SCGSPLRARGPRRAGVRGSRPPSSSSRPRPYNPEEDRSNGPVSGWTTGGGTAVLPSVGLAQFDQSISAFASSPQESSVVVPPRLCFTQVASPLPKKGTETPRTNHDSEPSE